MTAEDPLLAPLSAVDDELDEALADGLLTTDADERSGGPLPHGGSPHDALELLAAAGSRTAASAAARMVWRTTAPVRTSSDGRQRA